MQTLEQLVPPPADPVDARGAWSSLAGPRYPDDYRALIERYGTGVFAEFIVLRNPLSPNGCCQPEVEEDRFLIWATTGNGDRLGWELTDGEPNTWRVGVRASRSDDFACYDLSASELLTRWLDGSSSIAAFPNRDEYFFPSFEPNAPFRSVHVLLGEVEGAFEARLSELYDALEATRMRGLDIRATFASGSFACEPPFTKVGLSEIDAQASLGIGFQAVHEAQIKAKVSVALARLGWPVWRITVHGDLNGALDWKDLVNASRPEPRRR